MKTFRYVLYGKIKLTLDSVLHIGGSDNTSFKMAVDSNGKYILPSSGIAGAVGHAVRKMVPEAAEFLGDTDHDSKVYFYDAVCENAGIERRVGISIDDRYGTVGSGALINMDYVSPGMRTEICMQGFASTEEELDIIKDIFKAAGTGLASGNILLGAKKASGAGRFKVDENSEKQPVGQMLVLDLYNKKERVQYLQGVEACFASCSEELVFPDISEKGWDTYILTADAPSGILVAGGNGEGIADKVNMYRLVRDGEEKEYFIPGTTIKGYLLAYGRMAARALNVSGAVLDEIYGCKGSGLDQNGEMTGNQSRIFVRDCLIREPGKTIHNRIKIDRWLGSAVNGAKMNSEVLYTGEKAPISIEVSVSDELEDSVRDLANGLIYLALRDLGAGLTTIGSGSSIGRGRLKGRALSIKGSECPFDGRTIRLGEKEDYIRKCLKKLEEYGNDHK